MQIINTGAQTAEMNMQIDLELLHKLDPAGPPILHFYTWKQPSITYGYFSLPHQYLNLEKVQEKGIALAKRPTGGGIVFHLWDFAFSILMPARHPSVSDEVIKNYEHINKIVLRAVQDWLPEEGELVQTLEKGGAFCMEGPTIYDAVYAGKKIAGAAQRRRPQGYLHQGTISLAVPEAQLLLELVGSKEAEKIMRHSFGFPGDLDTLRQEVQEKLVENLRLCL